MDNINKLITSVIAAKNNKLLKSKNYFFIMVVIISMFANILLNYR